MTIAETPDDLTPRMAEILEMMFYGFDEGMADPTPAVSEALGESRSAIAAVNRHLVRRGWLERSEEGYTATEQAQSWWTAQNQTQPG